MLDANVLPGGFSGVERIHTATDDFIIVVNDATVPRQLDVRNLDGTLRATTALANDRFEDLAFDGRFLYAADYVGGRIVKVDVLGDNGSIFQPPPPISGVPEPTTLSALVGMGAA